MLGESLNTTVLLVGLLGLPFEPLFLLRLLLRLPAPLPRPRNLPSAWPWPPP